MGCSLFAFSLVISSFATNYFMFVLLYAVVPGFGYGLLYMVPLKCGWNFFPAKKGLVSGLVLCGYSSASIFFTLFTKWLVNPTNEQASYHVKVGNTLEVLYSSTSSVTWNFPVMIRVCSGILAVLSAIVILLVTKPTYDKVVHNLSEELLQEHDR